MALAHQRFSIDYSKQTIDNKRNFFSLHTRDLIKKCHPLQTGSKTVLFYILYIICEVFIHVFQKFTYGDFNMIFHYLNGLRVRLPTPYTGSPYYRLLEKYFVQEIIFRSFTYHCVVLLSSFRLHSHPNPCYYP